MKKTIKFVLTLVCLVAVALSALCSCESTPANEEVENGTVWEFSGVGEIEVINKNKSDSFVNSHAATVKSYYYTVYDFSNPKTKSDAIGFKDGKVFYIGYQGVGSPSFANGVNIYGSCEPYQNDFGTYSGSDINIVDVNEEIVDAYIRDGVLTLVHEDSTLRMELLFTKTNSISIAE